VHSPHRRRTAQRAPDAVQLLAGLKGDARLAHARVGVGGGVAEHAVDGLVAHFKAAAAEGWREGDGGNGRMRWWRLRARASGGGYGGLSARGEERIMQGVVC
jgi:hypothetical protein